MSKEDSYSFSSYIAYGSTANGYTKESEIRPIDESSLAHPIPDELTKQKGREKDWNFRFQTLIDQPESVERESDLKKLCSEFYTAATNYCRTIIEEVSLSDSQKTIKPVNAGGIAGGQKFVVDGIFVKLANDIVGLYGGDQYSMKAAGHELKGIDAIAHICVEITAIRIPLVVLVDYRGYRAIACSILPVDRSTLQYGSSDAGKSILWNESIHKYMKQMGEKLHLKEHEVGESQNSGSVWKLVGPADVEVHSGRDSRLCKRERTTRTTALNPPPADTERDYTDILDTARLLPPAAISAEVTALFIPADSGAPIEELHFKRRSWKSEAASCFHCDETSLTVTSLSGRSVISVVPITAASDNSSSDYSKFPVNLRATAMLFHQRKSTLSISTGEESNETSEKRTTIRGNVLVVRNGQLAGRQLFELLRSEFLQTLKDHNNRDKSKFGPLSSDVFSAFKQPNAKEDQAEVKLATNYLLETAIPEFVRKLEQREIITLNVQQLKSAMHKHGINLRYLGLVRAAANDDLLRQFLLTAMLTRVIAQELRKQLRSVGQLSNRPNSNDNSAHITVVIEYFNAVLGHNGRAEQMWRSELKLLLIEMYTQKALSTSEAQPYADPRRHLTKLPLFHMMHQTCGVIFKPEVLRKFNSSPIEFERECPFEVTDVISMAVKVKTIGSFFASRNANGEESLAQLQSRVSIIEKLHGRTSIPSITLSLQLAQSHLKTNPLTLEALNSAKELLKGVKSLLYDSIPEAPMEIFVMYHFLIAKWNEKKANANPQLVWTHYRCAYGLLERYFGGDFGHPFAMILLNKLAELAERREMFTLAGVFIESFERISRWTPFPSAELQTRRTVFDSNELLAFPSLACSKKSTTANEKGNIVPDKGNSLGNSSSDGVMLFSTEALKEWMRHVRLLDNLSDTLVSSEVLSPVRITSSDSELPEFSSSTSSSVSSKSENQTIELTHYPSGDVYLWGSGKHNTLEYLQSATPYLFKPFLGIKFSHLAISESFVLAVQSNGKTWSFGSGKNGALGHGNKEDQLQPKLIEALADVNVCRVAAGLNHSIALSTSGEVYTWGAATSGQLGRGKNIGEISPVPARPPVLRGVAVRSIAASFYCSFVVTTNGELWSCGDGRCGETAQGSFYNLLFDFHPVFSLRPHRIREVSAGSGFALALSEMGKVFSWGCNDECQLGIPILCSSSSNSNPNSGTGSILSQQSLQKQSESFSSTPRLISSLPSPCVHISCGWNHSIVILSDQSVYSFGANHQYQSGALNSTAKRMSAPEKVFVPDGMRFVCTSAGSTHSLAIAMDSSGEYVCLGWGSNVWGQLGFAEDRKQKLARPLRIQSSRPSQIFATLGLSGLIGSGPMTLSTATPSSAASSDAASDTSVDTAAAHSHSSCIATSIAQLIRTSAE